MRKSISMEQRFKAIVFLLNQNEVDAIAGYIPMTQPIFDSILDNLHL